MRIGNASTRIPLLLTILAALALPAVSAAGSKGKSARSGVLVSVDRRAYPAGIPVNIKVTNATRHPIYLPGCASYTLEQFDDRIDGFVPLAPRRC